MEREREEQHERTKGGMGLKVHVDMVATALQIMGCGLAGPRPISLFMPMPVAVGLYQGGPLFASLSCLPATQDESLNNEDSEEASSHDELWEGEAGLFEVDLERTHPGTCRINQTGVKQERDTVDLHTPTLRQNIS